MHSERPSVIVIGGGFFGAMIAVRLADAGAAVTIFERESMLLARASLVNQARVHGGYHYPRSVLTARRSRANYRRFLDDFPEAIVGDVTHVYAMSRVGSKVSASQFKAFCARIGAPLKPLPEAAHGMFDFRLVEDAFGVDESVFDAVVLRSILRARLQQAGVRVCCSTEVVGVSRARTGVALRWCALEPGSAIEESFATTVIDCTYSGLNVLRHDAGLPALSLKLEVAEIGIIAVPERLKQMAITVMDGPFFSVMPFPAAHAHSITHVRYTPRGVLAGSTPDRRPPAYIGLAPTAQSARMLRDAVRFVPALREATLTGSWIETKAILNVSESDDSRPIVIDRSPALPGFTSILGSKIDNVYDVLNELSDLIEGDPR
ncbi:MAG: FAD-dependent oxidoreductase [Chloroflexota bacterium]